MTDGGTDDGRQGEGEGEEKDEDGEGGGEGDGEGEGDIELSINQHPQHVGMNSREAVMWAAQRKNVRRRSRYTHIR